jgi:hypothetical protein
MMNKIKPATMITILMLALTLTAPGLANSLSIYDIQHSVVNEFGDSSYDGQIVDCTGGIVFHKFPGFKPRLFLYNPAYADGWGSIVVKDFTGGTIFDNVQLGDFISLNSVLVEESRGNTQLSYTAASLSYPGEPNSAYTLISSGNPLPAPLSVSVANIAAPVADPCGYFVTNHLAEKYEAMYLQVQNVTVTAKDLGKAGDNYVLTDAAGNSCWASDYMNPDAGGPYHPFIDFSRNLDSVSGIIEQYTNESSGWDYYQLLTTNYDDVIPEPTLLSLLALGTLIIPRKKTKPVK